MDIRVYVGFDRVFEQSLTTHVCDLIKRAIKVGW
jgi:hypothetical protein